MCSRSVSADGFAVADIAEKSLNEIARKEDGDGSPISVNKFFDLRD
jgi:hypothetical protein